ncbi:MAG: polysaccharide export protein [Pegethrix bostrychoides GSE-TBD4-15B]|jgi:polysaccharide export outer membrane protein|uniref:Polysaccharide export protein n=1 Tax=Pegethrix bostrychoides GSE-TBD4-15B TaxID=2839662 RepID=A0A951P9G5_9CYAN|nr:polysaccharide export protein [Pegethrix bostrychoides GSE-TBD4-15B]
MANFLLNPLSLQPVLLSVCLLAQLQAVAFAQSAPVAPSAPAPATASLSLDSTVPQGYRLGSGDQIQITVFGYEEYTDTQTVLPDGTISLPLLGSVITAGLTPDQLSQTLKLKLDPLLVDPMVTVSLLGLRSVKVNVAGAVQRPGPIEFSSERQPDSDTDTAPVIASALIKAGGVTRDADIRRVTLKRALPNGEVTESTINLWESISNGSVTRDFVLQDGDSLFVPQLAAGNQLDQRLLSRSRFAPETVRVRVVGEVKQPGEVQVPPASSVSSAVAIAGGPTTDAKLSQVVYVRMNDTGQMERQVVDLRNLTDSYQIQEGDVVIVPKQGIASVLDFAARLVAPLGLLFGFPGL